MELSQLQNQHSLPIIPVQLSIPKSSTKKRRNEGTGTKAIVRKKVKSVDTTKEANASESVNEPDEESDSISLNSAGENILKKHVKQTKRFIWTQPLRADFVCSIFAIGLQSIIHEGLEAIHDIMTQWPSLQGRVTPKELYQHAAEYNMLCRQLVASKKDECLAVLTSKLHEQMQGRFIVDFLNLDYGKEVYSENSGDNKGDLSKILLDSSREDFDLNNVSDGASFEEGILHHVLRMHREQEEKLEEKLMECKTILRYGGDFFESYAQSVAENGENFPWYPPNLGSDFFLFPHTDYSRRKIPNCNYHGFNKFMSPNLCVNGISSDSRPSYDSSPSSQSTTPLSLHYSNSLHSADTNFQSLPLSTTVTLPSVESLIRSSTSIAFQMEGGKDQQKKLNSG